MKRLVFILLAGAAFITVAYAQQVLNPPPRAAVCAYSVTPPTVTAGKFVYLQCNSTGSILVH